MKRYVSNIDKLNRIALDVIGRELTTEEIQTSEILDAHFEDSGRKLLSSIRASNPIVFTSRKRPYQRREKYEGRKLAGAEIFDYMIENNMSHDSIGLAILNKSNNNTLAGFRKHATPEEKKKLIEDWNTTVNYGMIENVDYEVAEAHLIGSVRNVLNQGSGRLNDLERIVQDKEFRYESLPDKDFEGLVKEMVEYGADIENVATILPRIVPNGVFDRYETWATDKQKEKVYSTWAERFKDANDLAESNFEYVKSSLVDDIIYVMQDDLLINPKNN